MHRAGDSADSSFRSNSQDDFATTQTTMSFAWPPPIYSISTNRCSASKACSALPALAAMPANINVPRTTHNRTTPNSGCRVNVNRR